MFGSLFGLLTTTLKTWNVFLLNTFSLKDKKKINDKNKYITLFLAGFYIKRNAYICNMNTGQDNVQPKSVTKIKFK